MSYAITTEPPFGPEEYQQGWREGYEQGRRDADIEQSALRDELRRAGARNLTLRAQIDALHELISGCRTCRNHVAAYVRNGGRSR